MADWNELHRSHQRLRRVCCQLEERIEGQEREGLLSEKDMKDLDKAVTLLKVGFKKVRKVVRRWRPARQTRQVSL